MREHIRDHLLLCVRESVKNITDYLMEEEGLGEAEVHSELALLLLYEGVNIGMNCGMDNQGLADKVHKTIGFKMIMGGKVTRQSIDETVAKFSRFVVVK